MVKKYKGPERKGRKAPEPQLRTRNHYFRVKEAFDFPRLREICIMRDRDFRRVAERQRTSQDLLFHKDRGGDILGVAHLDSVQTIRGASFANTPAGDVVYSPQLDDRLGVYVILDLLPKLGVACDVLLTTGEERCQSTAEFYKPKKEYNWLFQFDRARTDVVMYDYETEEYVEMLEAAEWHVGQGSISDICWMYDLGIAGFNFGVGYEDYHDIKAHVWLNDLFWNVARFLNFYEDHGHELLDAPPPKWKWKPGTYGLGSGSALQDMTDEEFDAWMAKHGWGKEGELIG